MPNAYIPATDAHALAWFKNFANRLTADPTRYGLVAADAASVQALVDAYEVAYGVVTDPAGRNPGTVAVKDEARAAAETLCRQYGLLIKYNAGITTQDKLDLGLRPVNLNRDPVPPPDSSPLLNVLGATPGSHTVRYSDTSTPDSGRKPFGVIQLQLFVAVAETPVVDPAAASLYGCFTKNPVGVVFDAEDNGRIATYFACWITRRGDTGPWSLPISMTIVA